MPVFESKGEAEDHLADAQLEFTNNFCPLRQDSCIRRCHCFGPGQVSQVKTTTNCWRVDQPFCKSPLISGQISVYNVPLWTC